MDNKSSLIKDSKNYGRWLFFLLLIFCFRVSAQLIQLIFPVSFLPPFETWHSGALPYWLLVVFQVIIILVFTGFVFRFYKGKETPARKLGKIYLSVGIPYFCIMIFRLAAGLTFASDHSWFGARIPTLFHLPLASFIILIGHFHYKYGHREIKWRAKVKQQAKR